MDIYFNNNKNDNINNENNDISEDEGEELNPRERKKDKLEKENLAEGHEREMNEKLDEREGEYTIYKN